MQSEMTINYFENGKFFFCEQFTGTLKAAKMFVQTIWTDPSCTLSAINVESKGGTVLHVCK